MTSESQERMLAIVTPENLDAVLALCAPVGDPGVGDRSGHRHRALPRVRGTLRRRRGCRAPTRRRRAATTRSRVSSDREPVADVPVGSLGDGPVYHRPAPAPADPRRAARRRPRARAGRGRFPAGTDLSGELLALLATPTIADKSWVYRQYDHQLFLNTVVAPGRRRRGAAAQGHAPRALALTTDGKARFCAARPVHRRPAHGDRSRPATSRAWARCRKALVNCLNFGNPEHPEVMWQFAEVVDGMSEACRGARHSRGRGQRQLLQRVPRRGHRPDPGRRGGRRSSTSSTLGAAGAAVWATATRLVAAR